SPQAAVAALVDYEAIANDHLPAFERSDIWDPSLRDFPVSRVAATERAEKTGEAMGVRVKPSGERRLQPVVDRFFYWLRATVLEARPPAHWWGDRMGRTKPPAGREDGAVLARPLRDRRGEDSRLSQDGAAARAVSSARNRRLPHTSHRRCPRSGDACLS